MRSVHDEVPILLLGESRRAALEKKLAASLTGWASQWTAQRDVRVKVDGATELLKSWTDANPFRRRIGATLDQPMAFVLCRSGFAQELLLGSLGNADAAAWNGPISTALQMQLMESLSTHLARYLDPRDGVTSTEDSSTARDHLQDARMRRWVGVAVQVAASRPFGLVLVDPNVVARLVPTPKLGAESEVLGRRGAAVRGSSIVVEVALGDTQVLFADLADIAVDDVIVLNQSLNAPVQVVCNGSRIVDAHLGRSGNHLAVSVSGG